jgi:hypothetical protein
MNPRDTRHDGWATSADNIHSLPASPGLLARLAARLLVSRYDGMLAAGVTPASGSALEVHARRLTTFHEREVVARSYRLALAEARQPLTMWTARSWAHRPNLVGAADLIDTVTLRLHSPRPVTVRGMARLRMLLTDGTGPLYLAGDGDLNERLRSALAAL